MPFMFSRNGEEIMRTTMRMRSMKNYTPMPLSSSSSVTFIPAMMDGTCGTSPTMQRMSPMRMMMMDMKIMMQNMTCIPEMMASIMTMDNMRIIMGSWTMMRDTCLQVMLCMMEMGMMCMVVPCFMMMPGMVFMCMMAMCAGAIMMMCWPMNGENIMRCAARGQMMDQFPEERWVYINGAMTSHAMMQSQMMQLSSIFGRPMTGIHNRTMGMVVDMMCMMMSKMMPMMNHSTSTMMYCHIRECLLDSSVRKVIIMGHGTGCSILSIALDRLHADLPIDVMMKMEIYTFGSAASHLSNPCMTLGSPMNPNPSFTRADGSLVSPVKVTIAKSGSRMEDTERVIPHMEHYAMSSDFFARCGIMHHTRSMLDNTMCGREIIINSMPISSESATMSLMRSGFTMSHYMNMLLPMSKQKMCMLDERVDVDIQTAEKREFTAQGMSMLKPMGLGRRSTSMMGVADMVDAKMGKAEKRTSNGARMTMITDGVAAMRKCAKECEGKTVRQLSRLWMYAGGEKPVGEGVGTSDGVGLGLNGMM